MKRTIVGTAGHIDHGKTKLIEALTGIDCDRWEEEKRRGITIDLGFAHMESGDLQVGFVDVPGHERFIDNALAGLGGIRVMLMIIAADEGVMPQTREHLAICELLEIPAALAVLTKTDLVEKDHLELAEIEVRELLDGSRFADAEIVCASSRSGDGIDRVRQKILALAERFTLDPEPGRPARLPIDRVFSLKGLGQIVTGTLTDGRVQSGDTLVALPGEAAVRVRSIQVHGMDRQEAVEGERTALRLGGADSGTLARGTQLVERDSYAESRRLLVRLTLLAEAPSPLEKSLPVRVHLATSEIHGRLYPLDGRTIEPGSTGTAEIRLRRPVVAARGDRFIIRRPSPATTLGGGAVLDPLWYRMRGARLGQALAALEGTEADALIHWVEASGAAGRSTTALAQRLGITPDRARRKLEQISSAGRVVPVRAGSGREERWLTPTVFATIKRRAARVLRDHFGRDRLAESMPKAEAIEKLLPGRAAELADTYLQWLVSESVIEVSDEKITLPGRKADMSAEESRLAQSLVDIFDRCGLTPPSLSEVKQSVGAKPQIVDGVLGYLRKSGKIVQLPGGLLIASSAVQRIRDELVASDQREFSVGDFKSRFGLSRKWAIPLLEHLDSIGLTRRVGNSRQLVRSETGKDT